MSTYNINLWFAKDENGDMVTINKIKDKYEGKYYCPLCGSEVIPKAMDSNKVSPHFAHIDRSKCSGESIVHYWVKNELIKKDDVIEIIENDTKQVMIKNIEFEKSYETPYGIYKPDITLTTYKDEIIFIEVNYTNKKKIEEYYLKWKHLGNTVIEFSIKNVYNEEDNKVVISNSFKAIYCNGMEFNIDKGDNEYVSYIKSLKIDENKLKEIEWFIDDIYRYKIGVTDNLEELTNMFMELASDKSNIPTLEIIYKSSRCQNVINEILNKRDEFTKAIYEECIYKENIEMNCNSSNRLVKDRVCNNTLKASFDVEFTNKDYFDKFKVLERGYNYFNKSYKNNRYMYCYFSNFNGVYSCYFKTELIINDYNDFNKYINILNNSLCIEGGISSKINEIINLVDFVIDPSDDVPMLKKHLTEMFTYKNTTVMGILINNNPIHYANLLKFIKDNSTKFKYNEIIEKHIQLLDIEQYKYVDGEYKKFDIKSYSENIIEMFNEEYDNIETKIYKLKEMNLEQHNSDLYTFLRLQETKDNIVDILNENGLFVNIKYCKELDDVYYDIKRRIYDLCQLNINKYQVEFYGENFINKNYMDYCELIKNDIETINASDFYFKMKNLLIKIKSLMLLYEETSEKEDVRLDCFTGEFTYSKRLNNYNVKIDNTSISVNNIKMINIKNILDIDDVYNKLITVLSMINNKNMFYVSENVISIYNKLVNKYKYKTYKKYYINIIDTNIDEITINIKDIGTFKITNNCKYDELSVFISDKIRLSVYGG